MKLFQILLPIRDNEGKSFTAGEFHTVQAELVEKFGGITAFLSSPGVGLWKDESQGSIVQDEIALFEVMSDELDKEWWQSFRSRLEKLFRQDVIVIRIHTLETL